MLKSGYDEELIDDRFITHSIKTKRKDLLQNRKRKKQRKVEKYCMVTNHEPTFPAIRKAFFCSCLRITIEPFEKPLIAHVYVLQ